MSDQFRDNGGYIPGLGYVHLKAGEHIIRPKPKRNREPIMIEPEKNIINHLIDAFMAIEAKRKRRLKPITKVRRHTVVESFGAKTTVWEFTCKICPDMPHRYYTIWQWAQDTATHHARNHHGEKR